MFLIVNKKQQFIYPPAKFIESLFYIIPVS